MFIYVCYISYVCIYVYTERYDFERKSCTKTEDLLTFRKQKFLGVYCMKTYVIYTVRKVLPRIFYVNNIFVQKNTINDDATTDNDDFEIYVKLNNIQLII